MVPPVGGGAQKKPGSARICVDFTRLNEYTDRPVHPMPSPREVVSNILATARVFSAMDAVHGYCQVPLDKASRHLTSFLTPWGRFRYARVPLGLISAGDEFNFRTGFAFYTAQQHTQKIVDDLLTHSPSLHLSLIHI